MKTDSIWLTKDEAQEVADSLRSPEPTSDLERKALRERFVHLVGLLETAEKIIAAEKAMDDTG